MKRICNTCGEEKDAENCFYVSNQRACCKSCMPQNKKVETTCITCGKVRIVSKASVRLAKGNCRTCAQKIEKNKPEVKLKMSMCARIQLIRQGGVPNAKKFTSERSKEKHHNWQGGITPESIRVRNSEEQKIWKRSVLERDNFTCQDCGQRGGKLCAHHIKSFSKFPELRNELSNGVTLCYDCHRKTHNFGIKSLQEIAA